MQWGDLDLEAGTVTFVRQLIETAKEPVRKPIYGPTKNDMPRTVDLAAQTVTLLREHKRHQAEMKMANRTIYQDHGLVFAKEWGEMYGHKDFLGLPLQTNNMGERQFKRLMKAANVKHISIHGLRHNERVVAAEGGCCAARRPTAARPQTD